MWEGSACAVCGHDAGAMLPHAQGAGRSSTRRGAGLATGATGLLVVISTFILLQTRDAAPAQAAALSLAAATLAPAAAQPTFPSAAVQGPDLPLSEGGAIVLNDGPQTYNIAGRRDRVPTTSKASFVSWMLAHTDQKEVFLGQKWDLAQSMLKVGSITHPRVLEAFLRTPREFFARNPRRSYDNAVLLIGYGQTISGPQMVGKMTDSLDPLPGQKILEIGTGSGYQSAMLSELCNRVFTVEIVKPLARETDAIYRKHESRYPEFGNIDRKIDDGYYGWAEHAPYDRIIVTCGIDHVPPELIRQLAPGGIMVIPVGPPSGQTILRITKRVGADGTITLDRQDIFKGKRKEVFVPFTSKDGGVHTTGGLQGTR